MVVSEKIVFSRDLNRLYFGENFTMVALFGKDNSD